MKKRGSRILSLALALGLCLTLLPAASAAVVPNFPAAFQGDGYYISATPYELQEGWFIETGRGGDAFQEGLLRVYRNAQAMDDQGYYDGTYQQVGYADKTGKVVLTFDDWEDPPASLGLTGDDSLYFSEGMCAYFDWDTELFGYVDSQGNEVILAQYRKAEPFQDGLARVITTEGDYLFLDKTGRVALAINDDLAVDSQFGDGLLAAKGYLASDKSDYFVGFLDKQGQPAITIYRGEWRNHIEDDYLTIREAGYFSRFSEGYAILHDYRGGRRYPAYVVIDTQGNQVSVIDAEPPARASIYPRDAFFSDGLCGHGWAGHRVRLLCGYPRRRGLQTPRADFSRRPHAVRPGGGWQGPDVRLDGHCGHSV